LITSFFASVVIKDTPLKPVQLLWVNMIMDSLASLALATERPIDALLERPPYRKKEYIISRKMVKHILGQAIFQALILFIFVFAGQLFVPEDQNMPPLKYTVEEDGKVLEREHDISVIKNGDYIMSGMLQNFDMTDLYAPYSKITPSRHLTVVFNMFVWLQIFNMLCARKINDEVNFMEGVTTNAMFIGVLIAIAGL
jgi:Ca2+ transporting ATPase